MGQCYTVITRLIYNDDNEKEICNLARNRFRTDPFDSMDDVMNHYLGDYFKTDKGEYEAEFHASYGFETTLLDLFSRIAPALIDGSYVHIYPDSGCHTGIVRNGTIKYIRHDDIEEEVP